MGPGQVPGAAALAARGIRKAFRRGRQVVPVLDVPLFELAPASTVGLSGPSGSGKSTLLNVFAGILQADAGEVLVGGASQTALAPAERDRFRARHIGYVFQTFNLLPPLSALENVMVPMAFCTVISRGERRERAMNLLAQVGLATRADRLPAELSYGEQQRVGIARAFANQPRLILADEPTASLEPGLKHRIAELLVQCCASSGAALLVASHDEAVLGHMQRVERMERINRMAGDTE